MALFGRRRKPATGGMDRAADRADTDHLEEFARTRRGVEAFVEPATAVTTTTVVLVAHDGEWTRRRVNDRGEAWERCRRMGLPVYDAQVVGYPQRMRDYDRRRKESGGG